MEEKFKKMVETRRKNGSYIFTEEHRKRLRGTLEER